MKFHKNKFLTTVAAVALVLAVAACGSSSNGDGDQTASMTTPATPTTPTDPTTQAPETPEDALATAQADYKALTDASTDEERAAAMTALEAALMLEGNEVAYITYLEKQVTDQNEAAAAKAAATVAKAASEKAAEVLTALAALTATSPSITVSASSDSAFTAKQ